MKHELNRNNETSSLQAKHIDRSPPPRAGATPTDPKHTLICLRDRKNWQKKENRNETQLSGKRNSVIRRMTELMHSLRT